MNKTPLFAAHQLRNAEFDTQADWMIPAVFAGVDDEARVVQQAVGVYDLTPLGTFVLEGPDARRFANGMFTNNITRLQPGQGNRSAMCDDRGRVQGVLDLYCVAEDRFEGVLEGVTAAWFQERYQMYIVFDDVEMSVSDGAPWVLSLQGPEAAGLLAKLKLPVPEGDHEHVAVEALWVARKDRSGHGGFDLLVPNEALAPLYGAMVELGAAPVGSKAQDGLRILAGRAAWPTDGTPTSMVHELRLNEDCCAFDKGCYVGQEIINRIDVKGQINKKLLAIRTDGPVEIGSEVVLDGKVMGVVTSTTQALGQNVSLAVLRKGAWSSDSPLRLRHEGAEISGSVVNPD